MTTKPMIMATEGERQKTKTFLMTKQQNCTCITLFCTFLCRRCTPVTWNFPFSSAHFKLWSRWTVHKSCLFPLLNLDTALSDSTLENFANICQIKWTWIRSMKFEAVRIHFLSDVFSLLSSKNFATMATWRNNFSSLLAQNFSLQ